MEYQEAGSPERVTISVQCNGHAKCRLFCRSLSAEEAGEFLGRSGRTVLRLAEQGRVRSLKLADGSYRFYLPHLIEDLTVRATRKSQVSEPDRTEGLSARGNTEIAPKPGLEKIKTDLKDL